MNIHSTDYWSWMEHFSLKRHVRVVCTVIYKCICKYKNWNRTNYL